MQVESNPCIDCFWYIFKSDKMDPKPFSEEPACIAFPKGIPEEIFDGQDPHTSRHKAQENDIVFKKLVY